MTSISSLALLCLKSAKKYTFEVWSKIWIASNGGSENWTSLQRPHVVMVQDLTPSAKNNYAYALPIHSQINMLEWKHGVVVLLCRSQTSKQTGVYQGLSLLILEQRWTELWSFKNCIRQIIRKLEENLVEFNNSVQPTDQQNNYHPGQVSSGSNWP